MKFIIYIFFFYSYCYGYGMQNLFPQYFAHKAYRSGNFELCKSKYTELLANNPYDAELNYNLGTIFYKEKKYEDALSYLNRAVLHATPNSFLHEQSLFNRANNFVQQKQFDQAIKDYQKVLQINPENEKARHNLQIVEQMLKDQDQQKNCKQDQKQSENKNKQQDSSQQEKQKENKSNEQSQNDNSNDSAGNKQNQDAKSDHDQEKNESNREEKEEQQQERDQKNNSSNEQKGQQQQQKNASSKNDKQTENHQADKLEKTKEKKEVKHEQSLHEQSNNKDDLNRASLQEKNQDLQTIELDDACAEQMVEALHDDQRLAKRSAMLLEKLDEHENNIQKKLLQMNVTKAGAQKYGQKNW